MPAVPSLPLQMMQGAGGDWPHRGVGSAEEEAPLVVTDARGRRQPAHSIRKGDALQREAELSRVYSLRVENVSC